MKWQPLPDVINGFKIIKDLGRTDGKTRKAIIECKVCHRHYEAQAYYLKNRKHCGCLRPPELECSYRRSHSRLVTIYKCMRARCYYEKDICYKVYGAKGIRICDEWLEFPDLFCEWSINNGYEKRLQIDRIDNNKDYCPENCRWSDTKTQARNRKGIKLTMDKARTIRKESSFMSDKELADKYNVHTATIKHVLRNDRWIE